MTRTTLSLFALFVMFNAGLLAQNVGIGTNTPDASAKLHIVDGNRGLLISNVNLSDVSTASPVTSPATGLLVWNTNAAVTGGSGTGYYYWDGTKWVRLTHTDDGGEFISSGGLVQNTTDVANDDFVFGSTSLDDIAGTTDNSRILYDKSTGAFRAGNAGGTAWDAANRGVASAAFNNGTTASGESSTAFGRLTTASGIQSFAAGESSTASGTNSFAMGFGSTASGSGSFAFGQGAIASSTGSFAFGNSAFTSGNGAMAIGNSTVAQGDNSIALGNSTQVTAGATGGIAIGTSTVSSGIYSFAGGFSTQASGSGAFAFGDLAFASGDGSVALGSATATGNRSFAAGDGAATGANSYAAGNALAGGDYSNAFGQSTEAPSAYETTIGHYSTTYTPVSTTAYDASDRLFTIGNGTSAAARSNAMVVLKNGNVGLGYDLPIYDLTITDADGGEVALGNIAYNGASGAIRFDENINVAGVCGFEMVHDGSTNTLTWNRGCTAMTEFLRFNRTGNAADFTGNVTITGNLDITGTISKGAGTFKIDHPLDPENKYLVHSFVESPDMMNVYSGNITTDANGFATVNLPEYFEAANKDFRYQLTVVGTFEQAIIKEKISDNHFVIQTSAPNVEVSWEVSAVRADAFAEQNRIEPEQEKEFKGSYLHPELYGASESQSESNARRNTEALSSDADN